MKPALPSAFVLPWQKKTVPVFAANKWPQSSRGERDFSACAKCEMYFEGGKKKFLITTNTSEPWADGRIETALQSLSSHAAGAKNVGFLAMQQVLNEIIVLLTVRNIILFTLLDYLFPLIKGVIELLNCRLNFRMGAGWEENRTSVNKRLKVAQVWFLIRNSPKKMPDLGKSRSWLLTAGCGGMLMEGTEGQQVWNQLQRMQTIKRKDLCSPGVRAGNGDVCLTGSTLWFCFSKNLVKHRSLQVILLKELPGADGTGNWVSCFTYLSLKPSIKGKRKSF